MLKAGRVAALDEIAKSFASSSSKDAEITKAEGVAKELTGDDAVYDILVTISNIVVPLKFTSNSSPPSRKREPNLSPPKLKDSTKCCKDQSLLARPMSLSRERTFFPLSIRELSL